MTFYQDDEMLDEIMYEIINNSFSKNHIKSIEDCWKVKPIFQHTKHQEYSGNGDCIRMDHLTSSESECSTTASLRITSQVQNSCTKDCREQYTENESGITVDNEELNQVTTAPSGSMGNSSWKPLPENLQPVVKYSPKSVKNYVLMSPAERRRSEHATRVRSHLLALGWQIEHSRYRGYERFRYISPDRELYLSLYQICKQLVKQDTQNCSNSISSGSQVVQAQIPLEGNTRLNRGAQTGCSDSEQHSSIVVEKERTTQTVMDVDSRRPGLRKRKVEFEDLHSAIKKVNRGDPFQQNGSIWGSCMNLAPVKMPSVDGQIENFVDGPHINTSSKRISPTSLSYLIDNCMISVGDKCYYNKKEDSIMKEGSITREGILCSCCGNVYSISKFEAHAGSSNHRPAANIVLENGKSLLELQTRLKQVIGMKGFGQNTIKQHIDAKKKDEDLTGFLHMCNYVPQQVIPPLEGVNKGNNFITHPLHQGSQPLVSSDDLTADPCQKVKNKLPQPEAQQRNDDNVFTAMKAIPHEALENNIVCDKGRGMCHICRHEGDELVVCRGGCLSMFHFSCIGLKAFPEKGWFCPSCPCGLCDGGQFDGSGEFVEQTMLCCDQCERGYHVGCLRKRGDRGLESCPKANWFCGEKCSKIFVHLQQLLGKSNPTGVDGLSWTVLKSNKHDDNDPSKSQTDTKNERRLLDARAVLRECFKRIIQPGSRTDLVTDIVFSKESSTSYQNYRGFYTMILHKGKKPISVANFRIHGHKVAELPLVGTRILRRRRGFCRILINTLQKLLLEVGVERLLLPAAPKLLDTWINKFGFAETCNLDRLQLLGYPILEFTDTILCQKFLTESLT